MDHISFTAAQYGMEPNQFIMQLQQSGQITSLFADVRRGKALAINIAKTSVKDNDGQDVDPKQYFGVEVAEEESEEKDAKADTKADKKDEKKADEKPAEKKSSAKKSSAKKSSTKKSTKKSSAKKTTKKSTKSEDK